MNIIYRHKEVDEHVAVLLHYTGYSTTMTSVTLMTEVVTSVIKVTDVTVVISGPPGRIGFRMDLWNPCIVIDFSSVQFLYLVFLGFPFDHRREQTVEFALIQSRANDPGINS